MSFDLINLVLLLAAAQGILLSFLIIQKHWKLFANYFLASLMLLLSITLLYLMLSELGWYKKYPVLMLLPVGLPLIANPLFYLYAKYLINLSKSYNKNDWLHFIPFLLFELFLLPDYLGCREHIIALFDTIPNEQLHPKFLFFNWLIIVQGVTYIILTLKIIKNYSNSLQKVFSNIEKIRLDWLRNIIILVGAVWFVFISENVFYLLDIHFFKIFDTASVFAALLVYGLGYLGLLKSEVFEQPAFEENFKFTEPIVNSERINSQQEKKYEKSGLTKENARKYLDQLQKLMEEKKPFLNSNLTLNQLAKMLTISPHNLSEVINTQLNQNFFDFVNQYRIEKVKGDLANAEKQNLTLLAIGLDAGFNSKSSFNAIFKKYTGKTPSEFQKTEPN